MLVDPRIIMKMGPMKSQRRGTPLAAEDLITLAQKLARDAERHAILSASLASQADRLMVAGLRLLEPPRPAPTKAARL
jgi:hypothetical protein